MMFLNVLLQGDGAKPEWADGRTIHRVEDFTVAALPSGMVSGKTSVSFLIDLPNGEAVLAETSLMLFLTAADLIRAKYGDPQ